jgi:cyclopropane fatty-acyl-phospholipid synthase-like methyltransferase
MRTAAEFNAFYSAPDPWSLERAGFRDRVFRRLLSNVIRGRDVLELGCGEGHLTQALFSGAKTVTGIDISELAIARARTRKLPNARFEAGDFLSASFEGFDVIAALECVYYLSPAEREAFFAKVASEHAGKVMVLSTPIIGQNQYRRYFTHAELMETFRRHRMSVEAAFNLNVYRRGAVSTIAAAAVRLIPDALQWVPERLIYQRLYRIRMM